MIFGLTPGEYQGLVVIPNYLFIIGGVLLWVGFLFLGVIAKRYEIVLGERTNWQFMMIAPTGILIFTILEFYAVVINGLIRMPATIAAVAYLLLLISGVLSFLGCFRFLTVVKGG
ncbi:hypothetical protein DRP53_05080 [candidate division WOR-3 bacterium]|uniref:Uncharacterized protein n=1 Tax=candidate division WOR-3 bacterium TaxID=2052148 RepID=A0A660SKC8_UNCW3|nr:MAG: hypothetical protein DRP53_05080 [candidate division WOR-3 bacterium]